MNLQGYITWCNSNKLKSCQYKNFIKFMEELKWQ